MNQAMFMRRATPNEVSVLERGMDFRRPKYRREIFLRFYEFHLEYRAHPGCVYYLFEHLSAKHSMTMEQKLWFAYINGNTQNPVTSWLIWSRFKDFEVLNLFDLADWFNANYDKLAFDTDRRYFKKSFLKCVENYRALVGNKTQEEFFRASAGDGPENFRRLWIDIAKTFVYFGRLSVFSYLEYLRIMGLEIECDRLFLDDIDGSRSHRNGLCKVLGRDDLDWHDSNPNFNGRYERRLVEWLTEEGTRLLSEAKARFQDRSFARDVGYFTLESALCTYKSWHRPNRRYANVYNDMLVDRIDLAEKSWGALPVFWDARKAKLPEHLRLEDNPGDPGVNPMKQNHYRNTGQVIMLGHKWPELWSDFDECVRRKQCAT